MRTREKSSTNAGMAPLLRRKAVQKWLGISREAITGLEKSGTIRTFRKQRGARRFYRTQELIDRLEITQVQCRAEPNQEYLRRNRVLTWLGVSRWELESWAALMPAIVYKKDPTARSYFLKSRIKRLIVDGPHRKQSKLG